MPAGEVVRLSFEQLKGLPFRELAGLWKEYVAALATLLVEVDGQEACPAGQRLGELIEELRLVVTCLMSSNPTRMHSLRRVLHPATRLPVSDGPSVHASMHAYHEKSCSAKTGWWALCGTCAACRSTSPASAAWVVAGRAAHASSWRGVHCDSSPCVGVCRAVKIDEDTDSPTPEPPPEGQAERIMVAMNFNVHQRREVCVPNQSLS